MWLAIRWTLMSMCIRSRIWLLWAWFLLPACKYSFMDPSAEILRLSFHNGEPELLVKKLQNRVTGYYPVVKAVSWQARRTCSVGPAVKPANVPWPLAGQRPEPAAVPEVYFWPLSPPRAGEALGYPCRTGLELPSGTRVGMWVTDSPK